MTNPLLAPWDTPFGLPPFDRITDDDFADAFEAALAEDRAEIDAIAGDPETPTFENTIHSLIRTGRTLDRVLGVFWTLAGTDANDTREALMRDFSPRMAAHSAETYANRALFARVAAVWEGQAAMDLSPEEARVLYLIHRGFVRAGAALEGAEMNEAKKVLATEATAMVHGREAAQPGKQRTGDHLERPRP